MDGTCNGWRNYPTWLLYSYIENDFDMYNHFHHHLRRQAHNDADDLCELIRNEIEEMIPDNTIPLFYDFISNTIAQVDFYEIAESIIEEQNA